MALLFALPCPLVSNFPIFCICIWFFLFFGGAVLPSLTGILLNTVEKKQRTIANSFAYLAYNLFGFLPSPFIYGAISDSGSGGNDRLAYLLLMYSVAIPCVTFSIACYSIFRDDVLGFKALELKALEKSDPK